MYDYVCVYAYVCVCLYVCVYTCLCKCVYLCENVCMYACMYVCVCVCVRVRACSMYILLHLIIHCVCLSTVELVNVKEIFFTSHDFLSLTYCHEIAQSIKAQCNYFIDVFYMC